MWAGDCMSHPVWVCGLKPIWKQEKGAIIESHPVWVCGLKLTQPKGA